MTQLLQELFMEMSQAELTNDAYYLLNPVVADKSVGPAVIVLLVFMFLLLGGAIFAFIKRDAIVNKLVGTIDIGQTAQGFLPFEDIRSGILDLGSHQYRIFLECSSINYRLKTAAEQEVVEAQFHRFLNTFSYPFSFYVQTRELDNRTVMKNTMDDANQAILTYPKLRDYADEYIEALSGVTDRLGNSRHKKKYIIISFDEASKMTNLNDEEKYQYARRELFNMAGTAISNLSALGIFAHILNDVEIAELIFRAMDKEAIGALDQALNGDFLTLACDIENEYVSHPEPQAKLDLILLEAINKYRVEILDNPSMSVEVQNKARNSIKELEELRNKYTKYYGSNKRGGN